MPKNKMNDPITDQEMAFARLILAGTMTDQRAAETAGLNPTTAAYTKSKPGVRAYMLEHRAAMQKQQTELASESLRHQQVNRQQVLARLWEIANLSPETTRGSIAGQVKALSMIVAIEGLIPNRRNPGQNGPENQPAPAAPKVTIYQPAWLRERQAGANATPSDAYEAGEANATDPPHVAPEVAPEVVLAQEPPQVAPESVSPQAQSHEPIVSSTEPAPERVLNLPENPYVPEAHDNPGSRAPFSIKRQFRGFRR